MSKRHFLRLLGVLLVIGANSELGPSQCVQSDFNPQLQKDLGNLLSQFIACSPDDPHTACNVFLAKAVKIVYGINDFIQNPSGPGDPVYLQANIIAVKVRNNPDWIDLGPADDQKTLDKAQEAANCKFAVLAVLFNPNGSGHVALVIPGLQTASGNWGLNVPNSASFFLNNPQKAYVGKGLSFAFSDPSGVEIYTRQTT